MVETITPVVHGDRRSGYRAAVGSHVLGAAAAATALGAALGAFGAVLGAPWGVAGLALVAAVAVVYAARELVGMPVPVLDRRRQVPEWWRTFFAPGVAAFLYGLGLGIGFLTFLTYGTFVAVAVAAVASGDPGVGALVCMPFGVARGLSVAVARRAEDEQDAAAIVDHVERVAAGGVPRRLNGAALVAIAVSAIALA